MTVATSTALVAAIETKRALPRALMGGTQAMRDAGKHYLPQEPAESHDEYNNRLARSFLFNGFGQAVDDFAGRVFAKAIILEPDVPPQIVKYCENIDLAGRDIDMFANAVFRDAVVDGIGYILADMDAPIDGLLTKADADALNRRPWLVHIPARKVLGWKATAINGVETLTQFRYSDDQSVDDGDFGEKVVRQVRVLSLTGQTVAWQTYRQPFISTRSPDDWVLFEEGRISLTRIPVTPVYINRTAFFAGEPPLMDMAQVNAAHWQSQSDQRNILHIARVPFLFGEGFAEDAQPIVIGAMRMLRNSQLGSDVRFVEHSGAAIEAGRNDLKDLEMQMQVLGLELTMPTPSSQSATGAAIDQAKMTTPLAMMSKAMEDALENALQFMAEFSGLTDGGSVELNKDFTIGFNAAADAQTILAAKAAGVISGVTVIRELQRRGILTETINPDEEVLAAMGDGSMDANQP